MKQMDVTGVTVRETSVTFLLSEKYICMIFFHLVAPYLFSFIVLKKHSVLVIIFLIR